MKLQAETLDFIVDYTKATSRGGKPKPAHMIDTKALQVFAAASIVLGLAAAGLCEKAFAAWLFGAAIATVTAFMVLRTRRFRIVDDRREHLAALLERRAHRCQARSRG
jgi:hypothetical protein